MEDHKLTQMLAHTFASDPFYSAITPGEAGPERANTLTTYFERALQKYRPVGKVRVDPEGQGVAIWERPGDKAHDGLEPLAALTDAGRVNAAAITDFSWRMTVGIVPEEAWYLSILGVAAAGQGQGIGGRLVWSTLAELDDVGAPSYLETLNPRSVPFYERLGYRLWRSEIEPVTGVQYWLMGRRASDP